MPEGPEIRIAADKIAAVLVGLPLQSVSLSQPHIAEHAAVLAASYVTAVDTHGKAMLMRFENGLTLYSHNQLYGRWFVQRRGEWPDTRRTLRVALHTSTHSALLYSASEIAVLTPAALAVHPFLCRLGPDVLGADSDPSVLAKRLDLPQFRGRALASLYLDQGFVAGIGNYLRSEILFAAGLAPTRRPRDLSAKERLTVAQATLDISQHAYRERGVTIPSALLKRLRAAGAKRRDSRYAVFGRDGHPCHRCTTPVVRLDLAGRRIYLCPHCQPTQFTAAVSKK